MNRNQLLVIGTVLLALGLGLGAFLIARAGSSAATTTSAPTAILPSSTIVGDGASPPLTDIQGGGPSPTDASGNPVTTIPGQSPSTATTIPGQTTTTARTGTGTTLTGGGPTVTTGPAQPADLNKQLAATTAQAGFPVWVLDDPAWALRAVRAAIVGDKTILDLSYGAGTDYLSISQESILPPSGMPNTEPVTVHGLPAELLDMGGVIVIRWNEKATSLALSTSLTREAALAAAEKLALYRG